VPHNAWKVVGGTPSRLPSSGDHPLGRAEMKPWIAASLIGLLGCAGPQVRAASARADPAIAGDTRLENLRRAARYPWTDEGACAVREAFGEWRALVERCYHALDLSRIQFRDVDHRCPVAQTNVAAVQVLVGICLLAALELAAEAVIVTGTVVVATAIAAEVLAAKKAKWCNCYCGRDPQPVLVNTQDFECRSECVLRGYAPTDYVCR
jgi:hypothetical protein